ncbi:MAG TPA: hypothetical protein VHX38_31930 [Pseudonocardiaceae bacterium]|nr:hypothetical protein [Pseudonocardiaceae bacterium]
MNATPGPEIERITGDLTEPTPPTDTAVGTAVDAAVDSAVDSAEETRPALPHWGSTLALAESLDELAGRFEDLCANAVDALEIAAGLEMDGLSDQAARVRYGFPDVFGLAEELYRRTSRQPAEPAALPNPWTTTIGRHVLHGLLFALPALCYPVAQSLLADRGALILLVVSMLVSWPASQGLSYLGHARRSRRDLDGSRWLLRAGLGVSGLVLVAVVLLIASLTGQPIAVRAFAAGQGAYLLAATVLLVAGAELWLCVALAPAVVVSAAYLLAGRPAALHLPAWIALALTLLLAVGFAVYKTSLPRPKPRRKQVKTAELAASAPYALFGLLVIGLLVFPLVAPHLLPGIRGADATTMIGTLPLSLSMGAAELQLYRYRSRIYQLLRRTRRLQEFAGRSRWILAGALWEYLAAAALLMIAVIGLAELAGGNPQWSDLPDFAGYLALGGALFLALLTQTCAGTGAVLVWCSLALCAEFALALADREALAMRIQLLCAAGLLAALLTHSAAVLSKANKHSQ